MKNGINGGFFFVTTCAASDVPFIYFSPKNQRIPRFSSIFKQFSRFRNNNRLTKQNIVLTKSIATASFVEHPFSERSWQSGPRVSPRNHHLRVGFITHFCNHRPRLATARPKKHVENAPGGASITTDLAGSKRPLRCH
ncbi:hypothetical protein JTE90_028851 [Oedothorax gibbosus]|uniref:Uncharacterized protein n=1 Tax=Oedothorax gibbosus TaxID=931172 RepID=A0AAV6VX45_9ARAC|nr:hypothetical protein JTE90_028851 [Oedothorax gibbosus]